MSPRAACRLVTLGFTEVYDYVAGKVDWLARNQPIEGTAARLTTIGGHLRADVVTAGPSELIPAVRSRVTASAHRVALVTTDARVLLGRLRPTTLESAAPTATAGDAMEPGPSTLRPHEAAPDVRARLQDKGLTYAIVTNPDGTLLGTIHAEDLT